VIVSEQQGHGPVTPAMAAGTESAVPQDGQENRIGSADIDGVASASIGFALQRQRHPGSSSRDGRDSE
jgi:hypothetical protein